MEVMGNRMYVFEQDVIMSRLNREHNGCIDDGAIVLELSMYKVDKS